MSRVETKRTEYMTQLTDSEGRVLKVVKTTIDTSSGEETIQVLDINAEESKAIDPLVEELLKAGFKRYNPMDHIGETVTPLPKRRMPWQTEESFSADANGNRSTSGKVQTPAHEFYINLRKPGGSINRDALDNVFVYFYNRKCTYKEVVHILKSGHNLVPDAEITQNLRSTKGREGFRMYQNSKKSS